MNFEKAATLRGTNCLAVIVLLVVVALVSASCSKDASTTVDANTVVSAPQPEVTAQGLDARVDLSDSVLTATAPAGIADSGTPVAITNVVALSGSSRPDFVGGISGGAKIVLGENAQPRQPMMLSFDLSKSVFATSVDNGKIPVVLAMSDGYAEAEVLPSTWDPQKQILSANTSHLSSFFPALFDPEAMAKQFTAAVKGYLGLQIPAPLCSANSVSVGTRTVTAEPMSNRVVQPCLSVAGSNVDVQLQSLSPQGWIVTSAPRPTSATVELSAELEAFANAAVFSTILKPVVGDGSFLLPRGSTALAFDPVQLPATVSLRVDATMNLINILVYGLGILYPNAALFELGSMATCVATLIGANGSVAGASGVGHLVQGFTECAGDVAVTKTASLATRSLAAILTVLPGGATLLATSITGLVGEFTGANSATLKLDVTDTAVPAADSSMATSTAKPGELSARDITALTVSTKLAEPVVTGKKFGPQIYGLNDDGRAGVAFNWIPVMKDPEAEYDGDDCQVEVTITGPQAFPIVKTAECHGRFATSFNGSDNGIEVTTRGRYTVTVVDRVSGKTGITTFEMQ